MGKFGILLVVLMVAAVVSFAAFNKDTTSVTMPFGETYEVPKISLMVFSTLAGALVMLLYFFVRDSIRFVVNFQDKRRLKKQEKIDALYNKAVNAILGDDDKTARSALEEILSLEPEHTDALIRLGNLDAGKGQLETASAYYLKALLPSGKNLEALFSLAEVMQRMGRWEDAFSYLDAILEIDSHNFSALVRRRALLERESRWEDLVEVQKTIVKLERDPEAQKREAQLLLGYRYELSRDSLEKGEFEKAAKGFRAILKESEDFIPAQLGVAEALLGDNDSEGAVSALEKAYESTRSQIILARLEDMLININEPMRLIRFYKHAISSDQANESLRFFLGKLYFRLEMVDDAVQTLTALDMGGEAGSEVHKLLGELALRRQQCEKAVEHFKKVLDIRKAIRVPYACSACGNRDDEWAGRCLRCGAWNTYDLLLYGPDRR
jgi:lipopolysaccharide biosynthesis regulator YciM